MRFHRLLSLLVIGAVALPAMVLAAPDGARLYSRLCAACHGDAGGGGVGVPLRLPAFQSGVSDTYLRKTIRHGRPGRTMPAFRRLSEAQINAIVTHIRGWNRDGVRPAYTDRRIQGDAEHGRELYAEHCAQCHGEQGQGGHGTGVTFSRPRDLPILAPALNNAGFLASASDAMIKSTLERGREGTPMVSFRDQGLSDKDLNDLVAHIRSYQGEHATAEDIEDQTPTLVYDSPYGLEETVEAVKRAAVGRNFRLIREQHLETGLYPDGEVNTGQVVVYFCNFNFLYDALAIDPRVGLFLPCRVTVVEREGQVQVMTINPRRLSTLFNNEALDAACNEMYELYTAILEEATF